MEGLTFQLLDGSLEKTNDWEREERNRQENKPQTKQQKFPKVLLQN